MPLFTQELLKQVQEENAQKWRKFWQVNGETYCEECDNGTDTPCTACLWEEGAK